MVRMMADTAQSFHAQGSSTYSFKGRKHLHFGAPLIPIILSAVPLVRQALEDKGVDAGAPWNDERLANIEVAECLVADANRAYPGSNVLEEDGTLFNDHSGSADSKLPYHHYEEGSLVPRRVKN